MERVLPSAEVKERMASLTVGLAADCDSPEREVSQIMQANLKGANTLPFVGFITHDGKWVEGFAGYKEAEAFLKTLEAAEKTPFLNATPAVQKQLAALVDKATKAAEKSDWKTVMKAGTDADKSTGRCPERTALAVIVKQARQWAAEQLDAAVKAAQTGADLTEARKSLELVRKSFAGEDEAADAEAGLKALKRLGQVLAAEESGKGASGIREKAAKEYEGTRWATVFDAAPPPDGEE